MHIAESEEEQFTGILPSIGDIEGAAQSGRYRRRVGDIRGAAQSSMRAPIGWYREKAFDIVQRYWKNHSPQERKNWLMTIGIRLSWNLLSMSFDDLPDEEFERIVDNIQSTLEEEAVAQESGPSPVEGTAQTAMRYSAWVGVGGNNDKILTKTMFTLFEAEVKRGWNESVDNRKKVLESVKDISGLSLPMLHSLSRWEELSEFTRQQIMLALMQGLAMAGEQAKKAQAAALVDDYEYSSTEGGLSSMQVTVIAGLMLLGSPLIMYLLSKR